MVKCLGSSHYRVVLPSVRYMELHGHQAVTSMVTAFSSCGGVTHHSRGNLSGKPAQPANRFRRDINLASPYTSLVAAFFRVSWIGFTGKET
ncbi:MAG: hypothetical protein AAF483_22170 [Planctomycetota bacterium]